MSSAPSAPEPRRIARSIVSLGMFAESALSMATRSRALPAGSAPLRAATVISRISLVKILPRRASSAFLRPSMLGPLPMGIPAVSLAPMPRRAAGGTAILTEPRPGLSAGRGDSHGDRAVVRRMSGFGHAVVELLERACDDARGGTGVEHDVVDEIRIALDAARTLASGR